MYINIFVNNLDKRKYLVLIQGSTFLLIRRNYYRINVQFNVNTIYYYSI